MSQQHWQDRLYVRMLSGARAQVMFPSFQRPFNQIEGNKYTSHHHFYTGSSSRRLLTFWLNFLRQWTSYQMYIQRFLPQIMRYKYLAALRGMGNKVAYEQNKPVIRNPLINYLERVSTYMVNDRMIGVQPNRIQSSQRIVSFVRRRPG
jgi:hypothetical protein